MTRLYLLTFIFFIAGWQNQRVAAQCDNLFFSEYIEGSSNNKVLEIFNPTENTVDLNDYSVVLYSNGSVTATNTLVWPENTLLAAGDVYVIANASADSVFLALADTTSTVTFYNGNDALALVDVAQGGNIDIIGEIGANPNPDWPVGTGSTSNNTLVRKSNINQGQTNWTAGALEWAVFPSNFADSLGFHNIDNCEAQSNAIASFATALSSGPENIGSDTAYISLSGITTNFTLSIEIVGASSTAANPDDWTSASVPGSISISPGQTTISIPFSIVDDELLEEAEVFVLKISEATGGLTIGNSEFFYTIIDNDNPPTPPCQFAFFSEYIEGSSNNKMIEIYNPTDGDIDLGNYRILRFNNGNVDTSGVFDWPQGSLLASGEVYVIGNGSADSVFLAQADTISTITFYNGNDALSLIHIPSQTPVDIIGRIGEDPGSSGWPLTGGSTTNNTLVRDPAVNGGQTNWFLAAETWIAYESDFADSLGAHYMTPCNLQPGCDTTNFVINATVTDESVQDADDGAIDVTVSGGLPPYSYSWSNGALTEDLSGLAPGVYVLTLTDQNECSGTATFTVAPGPGPCDTITITISGDVTDESVLGAGDGAIDATVEGGVEPYTYSWSNSAATEDISGLAPATYVLTVTDDLGCSGQASFTVAAGPDPCAAVNIQVSAAVTDETASGAGDGAIDLTVSGGTSPYTFNWNNGADTEDISGLDPGTYTVTVTDADGCSGSATATVDAGPTGVNDIASLKLFSVYPNPTNGSFKVALQFDRAEEVNIRIADVAGQIVYDSGNMTVSRISLPIAADWAAGVYFIRVQAGDKLAVEAIAIH